jgi:hypothetical protein
MPQTKTMPIRLAMRVEGDWWVAYLAQADKMDGAKRLGSILMGVVENNPDRKKAFMAIMQSAMTDAIKDVFGQTPDWGAPQSAPEAERAGRA